MAARVVQYGRSMAVAWMLGGIAMMAAAFTAKVPNQQYVQLLAEKVILERQDKPHDHLNPDSIEKYRPAWKNPLFIFGAGALVLSGVQLAISLTKS